MTKNGDKKRHLLAAQKSFAAANLHVCRRRMIGLIICYPTALEHPPCQDRICHVLELQRLRGKPNLKHYFCISDGNRQISQISDICFAWLGVIGNIGYLRSFRPRLVNTGQGLGICLYLHISRQLQYWLVLPLSINIARIANAVPVTLYSKVTK